MANQEPRISVSSGSAFWVIWTEEHKEMTHGEDQKGCPVTGRFIGGGRVPEIRKRM